MIDYTSQWRCAERKAELYRGRMVTEYQTVERSGELFILKADNYESLRLVDLKIHRRNDQRKKIIYGSGSNRLSPVTRKCISSFSFLFSPPQKVAAP